MTETSTTTITTEGPAAAAPTVQAAIVVPSVRRKSAWQEPSTWNSAAIIVGGLAPFAAAIPVAAPFSPLLGVLGLALAGIASRMREGHPATLPPSDAR